MAKKLMVVMSNPADGKEDEYNEWYSNTHLGDVLKAEPVVAAQRFALAKGTDEPTHGYLAIYEVEADDMQDVMKSLSAQSANGQMTMSDSLGDAIVWFATSITDRVTE